METLGSALVLPINLKKAKIIGGGVRILNIKKKKL
jgi:hypothetical protein